MRQSHLILSNAVIMWVTRVLLLVPQLILVPYLLHTIGESGYGVYVLVWSLMMSIEQFQMALQQGVVKYSAAYLAQGHIEGVNRVVSSSLVYSISLAVLACVGTLIAASSYNDPSGQIGPALSAVGITVLFIVPLTPYIALIQSRQRYYVGAIAETASKYIGLVAVLIWFHVFSPSVEALVVIMATMLFLSRLAQVPVAYRMVPGLRNRPSLCNREFFMLIVSFGGAVGLIGLCLMANSAGIRWMMNIFVSTRFVAHLAIILMPGLLLSQFIYAITITAMPATSAYEATGNHRMLQELLIRGMRYTTILALAGLFAAALLMKSVLKVWVGTEYVFLAPYALALLVSGAFMQTTSIAHHMLKGLGWLRATVLIYIVALVIVPFSLIVVLFQFLQNPYLVVTIALSAGNIIHGCLQIIYGAKAAGAKLQVLIRRAYLDPLFIATIVSLIVAGITVFTETNGIVQRTVTSVLAVVLFFTGCYVLVATARERQEINEILRVVRTKLAGMRCLQSWTSK